jgi:hypothetical protein
MAVTAVPARQEPGYVDVNAGESSAGFGRYERNRMSSAFMEILPGRLFDRNNKFVTAHHV